jgi:cell wall-associated NlpC family hydrolase
MRFLGFTLLIFFCFVLLSGQTPYTEDFLDLTKAQNWQAMQRKALEVIEDNNKKDILSEAYLFEAYAIAKQDSLFDPKTSPHLTVLKKVKKSIGKDKSKATWTLHKDFFIQVRAYLLQRADALQLDGKRVAANYLVKTTAYTFDKLEEDLPNHPKQDLAKAKKNNQKPSENNKIIALKDAQVQELLRYAQTKIGIPYKLGGVTDKGYDCSGFVQEVFGKISIKVPRTTEFQVNVGKEVSQKDARAGDLVFFHRAGKVHHVGIVIENTKEGLKMIHASVSRGIRTENIQTSKYWSGKIKVIKRIDKATYLGKLGWHTQYFAAKRVFLGVFI